MASKFVEPSHQERSSAPRSLVGRRISIWWDGDNVFYPAKVVDYQESDGAHVVKYDNDDGGALTAEILSTQQWQIWDGSDEEFDAYNQVHQQVISRRVFPTYSGGNSRGRHCSLTVPGRPVFLLVFANRNWPRLQPAAVAMAAMMTT